MSTSEWMKPEGDERPGTVHTIRRRLGVEAMLCCCALACALLVAGDAHAQYIRRYPSVRRVYTRPSKTRSAASSSKDKSDSQKQEYLSFDDLDPSAGSGSSTRSRSYPSGSTSPYDHRTSPFSPSNSSRPGSMPGGTTSTRDYRNTGVSGAGISEKEFEARTRGGDSATGSRTTPQPLSNTYTPYTPPPRTDSASGTDAPSASSGHEAIYAASDVDFDPGTGDDESLPYAFEGADASEEAALDGTTLAVLICVGLAFLAWHLRTAYTIARMNRRVAWRKHEDVEGAQARYANVSDVVQLQMQTQSMVDHINRLAGEVHSLGQQHLRRLNEEVLTLRSLWEAMDGSLREARAEWAAQVDQSSRELSASLENRIDQAWRQVHDELRGTKTELSEAVAGLCAYATGGLVHAVAQARDNAQARLDTWGVTAPDAIARQAARAEALDAVCAAVGALDRSVPKTIVAKVFEDVDKLKESLHDHERGPFAHVAHCARDRILLDTFDPELNNGPLATARLVELQNALGAIFARMRTLAPEATPDCEGLWADIERDLLDAVDPVVIDEHREPRDFPKDLPKEIGAALKAVGIQPVHIDMRSRPFNPDHHEVKASERDGDPSVPPGAVLRVLRGGYLRIPAPNSGQRPEVIRKALVITKAA